MNKSNLSIATVIVTYNAYRSEFFPTCLDKALAIQKEDNQFKLEQNIIVVDSASSDRTPDLIQKQYDQISLIAAEDNLGYAGGYNRAFQEAVKSQPDYIALITQDVYVEPDWLLKGVKAMHSDNNIAIVQPLLLLADKPHLINSSGNHIHFLGYGFAGDYLLPRDAYANDQVKNIAYPSGACLLIKPRVLQEVGGFDDEMWMYNEDEDIGWRMWLAGYRCVLNPKSIVYHQYEFSRSISKLYYMDRNRLLNILQNYHILTLVLLFPAIVANEAASFFFALSGGWKKEKLQVWRYFFSIKAWKKLLDKRTIRQRSRKSKEKEIIQRFTGKIAFQDVMNPVVKYFGNPILSVYWKCVKILIIW